MLNDNDYENMLISQILAKPELIDIFILEDTIFKLPEYRHIFQAINCARNKSKQIDSIMIADELRRIDPNVIGLFASISPFFSTSNAEHYINALRERNRKDGIKIALAEGLDLANGEEESFKIAEGVEEKIAQAVRGRVVSSPLLADHVSEIKNEIADRIFRRRNGTSDTVCFGVPGVMEYLNDLCPGEIILIGARTSVGKTAMALQALINMTYFNNIPSLMISLEMSRQNLIERIIAGITGIPYLSIRQGAVSDRQKAEVENAVDMLGLAPISIVDASEERLDISLTKSYIRREKTARNIRVVFIDYVGLLDRDDGRTAQWERMSEISKSLKLLAQELKIIIIELVQLNREADGVEPTSGKIRASGSFEQDSDRIVLLHPTSEYDKEGNRDIKAIITKNRNGRQGHVELLFCGSEQVFKQR